MNISSSAKTQPGVPSFGARARRDWKVNYSLYLLVLPVVAWYIVFNYIPMYGAIIAFKDYSPGLGILGSPWVGFKHFINFFNSPYFGRLMINTLLISVYSLIWGFPAPIILALMLNELKSPAYKKSVQTISYMPHFISTVVIVGMIKIFCASDGLINNIAGMFGASLGNLLQKPEFFRTIYVASGVWQGIGWGTIIYLSALSNIDQQLYEAAEIDGAGKWKRTLHVTLPGIAPTIVILLIMRIGSLLGVGYEKIILMYNPMTYETADVISTYVYRQGLLNADWSFSSAVGLFNSIINLILLVVANSVSKRVSETSLW